MISPRKKAELRIAAITILGMIGFVVVVLIIIFVMSGYGVSSQLLPPGASC